MPDGLGYDSDFYLWTAEQARRLRGAQGQSNSEIDWANVAEEIESLGRSDKREVRSRLRTIFEHLLKLGFSQACPPRDGWIATVDIQRRELAVTLEDSPSLRSQVESLLDEEVGFAREIAAKGLARYGESEGAALIRAGAGKEFLGRVLDHNFIPHPSDTTKAGPATSE